MEENLAFRAALIDAFIERLKSLGADTLRRIDSAGAPFDNYYQTALRLASEATHQVDPDRTDVVERILKARFAAIDALIAEAFPPVVAVTSNLRALAKGAARALMVRQTLELSGGAFAELWAPFRAHMSLIDIERDARKALTQAKDGSNGIRAAG
ncbi:MAG TPA: hypothetical protein VLE53_02590 [Gemmatimonadaceae bacterium]|nr:hypothetical protein [Gemmatimonadaceae bacterium]